MSDLAAVPSARWRPSPALLRSGLAAVALLLLAGWLGSGFYLVDTDQQGVVRRFGAIEARVGPGMHYRLPWPIDRVDVVRTKSVMKTGVGFELPAGEQTAVIGMPLMTGDTNLLSVALVLQYVIRNPADYLFRIEDPQTLIGNLAETVLTEDGCLGCTFHNAHRLSQHAGACAFTRRLLGKATAEGARPRPPVVEAQDVAGDIVEATARAQVPLSIRD